MQDLFNALGAVGMVLAIVAAMAAIVILGNAIEALDVWLKDRKREWKDAGNVVRQMTTPLRVICTCDMCGNAIYTGEKYYGNGDDSDPFPTPCTFVWCEECNDKHMK